MKKKFSPVSAAVLVATLAAMAVIMLGAMNGNIIVAASGLALGFLGIMAGNAVKSVIAIKKRYPERNDPLHRKMRAARYTATAAAMLLTLGMITMFIGFFLQAAIGIKEVLPIGGTVMAAGFALAIGGTIASSGVSRKLNAAENARIAEEDAAAVPPPSVSAAEMPYSPDPVISRVLENPYVLLDERIRQLHEVQNLLQYPEIQQVFFEPMRLYALFTDDRVGELLNIVRDWITRNNADEIFAAVQRRPKR